MIATEDNSSMLEAQNPNIVYDTEHAFYKASVRKKRAWGPMAYVWDE